MIVRVRRVHYFRNKALFRRECCYPRMFWVSPVGFVAGIRYRLGGVRHRAQQRQSRLTAFLVSCLITPGVLANLRFCRALGETDMAWHLEPRKPALRSVCSTLLLPSMDVVRRDDCGTSPSLRSFPPCHGAHHSPHRHAESSRFGRPAGGRLPLGTTGGGPHAIQDPDAGRVCVGGLLVSQNASATCVFPNAPDKYRRPDEAGRDDPRRHPTPATAVQKLRSISHVNPTPGDLDRS